MQRSRTRRRHLKMDNQTLEFPSSIGDFDKYLDFCSYSTIPEANTLMYPNARITILEGVYEILRDIAFTPDASKMSTSARFKQLTEKFLPENNMMPASFDQALQLITPFLMLLEKFHVCPHDCVIFGKEFTSLSKCPVCDASRYKDDNKTAWRNFTYFPITPRILRLFATEITHKMLREHFNKGIINGRMNDIHDSNLWREDWFGEDGEFRGNENSVVLNICLDGVNPFKSNKIDYSVWPIEIAIMNFPPELRKSCGGTLIAGLIPSMLALEKCKMKDSNGNYINVSMKLLEFTLDYPAIGKVLHYPGSGRSHRACMFCDIVGESSKVLNKTLFLQNRCFLDQSHKLRFETIGQVRSCIETRDPPSLQRTIKMTENLRKEYDELKKLSEQRAFVKEHGVKGTYEFMRLSYHRFQLQLGLIPTVIHSHVTSTKA